VFGHLALVTTGKGDGRVFDGLPVGLCGSCFDRCESDEILRLVKSLREGKDRSGGTLFPGLIGNTSLPSDLIREKASDHTDSQLVAGREDLSPSQVRLAFRPWGGGKHQLTVCVNLDHGRFDVSEPTKRL
jgi:hypothetical protein